MHLFDNDISLIEVKPGCFNCEISDNWLINGNSNGGYLMAIIANGLQKKSSKNSISIQTASFLSPVAPGKAELVIEEIGSSRNFHRLQARLLQDGSEKVRSMGTFVDKNAETNSVKIFETGEPDLSPVEECTSFPEIPGYSLFNNIDVKLDPSCAGLLEGKLSDISEFRGWIKFKEDRIFDELSLVLFLDSFPPPVLASQGLVAWVPTIELSLNIRSLPKTKWLKSIFRSRFISNGIVEEDGEIWDGTGELVAISRQISQFRKKE